MQTVKFWLKKSIFIHFDEKLSLKNLVTQKLIVSLHQFSHIFGQMGGVERLYSICFFYPKSEIPLFPLTFIIRNKQDIRQEYSS